MGRFFIFGTGAHARKVYHYAVALGHEVAGFVDENAAAQSPISGMQVFHAASLRMPAAGDAMFVAVGRADVRMRLMDYLADVGWELPALVHPSAWVAPDAQVGEGVLVAAGAVVETLSVLGRGAIVDIGVLVDHECRVGAFCHLKPGEVFGSSTVVPSPV